MIITLTNNTAHAINYPAVGEDGVALPGGNHPEEANHRYYPLPYPFDKIGTLAAGAHVHMPMHPRDWGYQRSQMKPAMTPSERLNQLVQNGTILFAVGAQTDRRDLLSRISWTIDSVRNVSPMKTGLGKRTSSQPRLATVVPSVVSATETPTIRLSVKQLLTMRVPNSEAFMASSSRCSAAGLCVSALKMRLSASVTVRRSTCSNRWPTLNCS